MPLSRRSFFYPKGDCRRELSKTKERKIVIITSIDDIQVFCGNADFDIYEDLQEENGILLEDSRRTSREHNIEHQDYLNILADWCHKIEIRDSYFVMVEPTIATLIVLLAITQKDTNKNKDGFVYIIFDEKTKYTKIGKANDVNKRLSGLKCSNVNLKLYGFLHCKNAFNTETFLHQYFNKYKVEREWFNISPDIVYDKLEEISIDHCYQNAMTKRIAV